MTYLENKARQMELTLLKRVNFADEKKKGERVYVNVKDIDHFYEMRSLLGHEL